MKILRLYFMFLLHGFGQDKKVHGLQRSSLCNKLQKVVFSARIVPTRFTELDEYDSAKKNLV